MRASLSSIFLTHKPSAKCHVGLQDLQRMAGNFHVVLQKMAGIKTLFHHADLQKMREIQTYFFTTRGQKMREIQTPRFPRWPPENGGKIFLHMFLPQIMSNLFILYLLACSSFHK